MNEPLFFWFTQHKKKDASLAGLLPQLLAENKGVNDGSTTGWINWQKKCCV
jgi:hypothetical protein